MTAAPEAMALSEEIASLQRSLEVELKREWAKASGALSALLDAVQGRGDLETATVHAERVLGRV